MKALPKINETKRLFFNKFVFKVSFELGGISYLKRLTLNELQNLKPVNRGITVYSRYNGQMEHAYHNKEEIIKIGLYLEDVKKDYVFHTRFEGSTMSVYTNDEILFKIVQQDLKKYLSEVWQPANKEAENFLRNNVRKIICNELPSGLYRYKVHLANKHMPEVIKNNFLSWSQKYGEEKLYIPSSARRLFTNSGDSYFYGQYFYASDEKMKNMALMFLSDHILKTEHYVLKTELV